MLRRVLVITFALLVSGAAAMMVHAYVSSRLDRGVTARNSAAAVVRVLVASTELPTGALLRSDQLHWQVWPADGAAPYVVEGRATTADFDGAVLRSRLAAGEPIIPGEVARPGERGFLAAVLAPGDSAVSIDVTPRTGLAGFVIPGDRVDLLLTTTASTAPNAVARRRSQTLLSNLRIVGVDQDMWRDTKTDQKDGAAPKTVTLEVTPKQAEIVAVASDLGVLSLSLRSLSASPNGDRSVAASSTWDTEVTQVAAIRAHAASRPVRGVLSRVPGPVRVYRGGQADDAAPSVASPSTPSAL